MNSIEAIAAALIVVNVALVARRSIWNYPFAIAAVAIYAVVFARARLYSDMLLQGFFLVVNLYGWVNWARIRAAAGDVLVETLTPQTRALWAAGVIVAAAGWGTVMHRYTDASYPWWDAGIAGASIAAQVLQARRRLESWWLWIAVDVASVPLYAAKGLWFTTALYLVLLAISVAGLIDWRRARAVRMVMA
ncbi:nicotinamide riboside transporter PnuC [Sphingomonas oligophenolica]|uniref:Nicotinamide riboside transporter PnuC n=1 Tax=Sphingomonas oligophenolica TaxID=301154 RepID=A0A502CHB1_9SPHN|nr:nicotinamide riboside transporter PnuC [Sphingomonas oligophenolica]TPG12358.1 nicotinamide riboside transporter PnuC [Sphingomonas oligophenolica]